MTIDELHTLWDARSSVKSTRGRSVSNRGKVAASEHDLQVACVRWFRLQFPKYARLLFAIPNGGQRNAVTAAKLKAEGVVAGVPDLFLAVPRGEWHGLWIEMKNGRSGRVSEKQTEMIGKLHEQGYQCAVAHSFEEFENIVKNYILQLDSRNLTCLS